MISEQEPGCFSIRIGRVTRSHGDDQYRITIGDEPSGLQILVLNLTAQQFAEVITGLGHGEVEGEMVAPQYRSRLGLRVEHHTESFSRFLSPEQQESLAKWAELSKIRLAADSFSINKHNNRTSVTFRWYRDPASEPLSTEKIEAALASRPDWLTAKR